MERQKQYMEAYLKQVKEEARTDKTLITRLVKDIEEHMVTNMAKDQYMDMGAGSFEQPAANRAGRLPDCAR